MSRKRRLDEACLAPTPPTTSSGSNAPASPKRVRRAESPPLAILRWLADSAQSATMPSSAAFDPPPSTSASSTGKRSSSPGKSSKKRDATSLRAYRHLVQRAGIVVEERHVPSHIQQHIDAIVDADTPISAAELARMASALCNSAWDLENAVEKPWVQAASELIRSLRSCLQPATSIKLVMEDEWRSAMLPAVPVQLDLPSLVPQKRPGPASDRVPVLPPLPPTSSLSLPELKTPRPDIHLEFAPSAFAGSLAGFLEELQDTNLLPSDPCGQVDTGRFPFLVCEMKSSATGNNLYAAQNQAAVGAASAINIIRSLQDLSVPDSGAVDAGPRSTASEASPANDDLVVIFSVVNESPTFQLWAHYWDSERGKYVGTCVGDWRVTDQKKALQFAEKLAAILHWALTKLQPALATAVSKLESGIRAKQMMQVQTRPANQGHSLEQG